MASFRAQSIIHQLRKGSLSDRSFDAIYERSVRAASLQFWTPVAAALRAARWLRDRHARKVLDIGSGPGKFCIVAAAAHPDACFHGIEHRARLVTAAQDAARALGVGNVSFEHGDATVARVGYDAIYLFNPFAENVFPPDDQLDEDVELTATRYLRDTLRVEALLTRAPVGTHLLSYHRAGARVPASYALVESERMEREWLRLWVKERERAPGFFFEVEEGVLGVGGATSCRFT
jgi:SAM-dependent methyltransferase